MQKNKILQIDSFTNTAFKGNPAAVCVLNAPATREWMQQMGAEMNLSETAFVWKENSNYRLRWFTPTTEVDLCGHATLATVFALHHLGELAKNTKVKFETASGVLTGQVLDDGWIELDFPLEPPTPTPLPKGLLEACRIQSTPLYTGKNRLGYLIELPTEEEVRNLQPDIAAMKAIGNLDTMITAKANSGSPYDCISRLFAPGLGIPEDPVTGAMHCCVGPYWAEKLKKDSLFAYQASARGGEIRVKIQNGRALLQGQAVLIFEGTL